MSEQYIDPVSRDPESHGYVLCRTEEVRLELRFMDGAVLPSDRPGHVYVLAELLNLSSDNSDNTTAEGGETKKAA